MRVRVINTLDDLYDDMRQIPVRFAIRAPQVVDWNVNRGLKIAQRIAREKSGPHGKNYFKRLSAEMTGPLTGEYGPHAGGTPVGAGFRHEGPNMDLQQSADRIGPDFAADVGDMVDSLFWG